jgi:hypothetical protein
MDERIASIKAWLQAKNVTLWMSWDLTQEDELDAAARWLATQFDDWTSYRTKMAYKYANNVEYDVV